MPIRPPLLTSLVASLALVAAARAQEPAPTPPDPDSPGFSFRWGLSEDFSLRDPLDAAGGTGGGETVSESRLTAGLSYGWGNRADVTLEGIVSALDFDDVEVDLLRGYLDLHGFWSRAYTLRVGRFGLGFGDGRFFGSNRRELVPDAWDGIQIAGEGRVDWQFFHVTGGLGAADLHDQTLTGGRVLWPIGARTTLDTALVQLDQDDLFRTEIDLLVQWTTETVHGQVWDLFLVLQDGEDTGFRDLWSQAAVIRFEQPLDFESTFYAEVGIATGDDVPLDRDSNTFTPSLIDFHRYTGRADVLAFSNLIEFAAGWRKEWSPRWTMDTSFHVFQRQNTDDVLYLGVDATPIATPGGSTSAGREFDLALETRWNDHLFTEFGIAYFLTGAAFVHDEDILVAYLWLSYDG